jgi:hypothetical protein
MSWDGQYVEDRYYPEFIPGDEVVCNKKYKTLTVGKTYQVIKCYNQFGWYPELNSRVIVLLNDKGFESVYASYNFQKSESQLRDDKIKEILNESSLY